MSSKNIAPSTSKRDCVHARYLFYRTITTNATTRLPSSQSFDLSCHRWCRLANSSTGLDSTASLSSPHIYSDCPSNFDNPSQVRRSTSSGKPRPSLPSTCTQTCRANTERIAGSIQICWRWKQSYGQEADYGNSVRKGSGRQD